MEVPSATEQEQIRVKAKEQGITIVSVVNFSLVAAGNGKTEEITSFGKQYVSRSMVVTEQNGSHQLLSVVIDPLTGELTFIPSTVKTENGVTEFTILAPHNSLYAVVEMQEKSFGDIQQHWAKKEIEQLASRLLIKGTSAGIFHPDSNITRAEFTSLLSRALGLEMHTTDSKFEDVPSNKWYAQAIHAAVQANIIDGQTESTFGPNDLISREEMAVMLARALHMAGKIVDVSQKQEQILSSYIDKDSISLWAQTAVAQSLEAGILQGQKAGVFAPKAKATRAEAAVVLKRLLQYIQFID
jgi:hypothetical protein